MNTQRVRSVPTASSLDDIQEAVEAYRHAGTPCTAAALHPADGKSLRRQRFSISGIESGNRAGWLHGLDEDEEAATANLPANMQPLREAPIIPAEVLMPELGRKAHVVLDSTPSTRYVQKTWERKAERLSYLKTDQIERYRLRGTLPSAAQPAMLTDRRKPQAGAATGPAGAGPRMSAQPCQAPRASVPPPMEGQLTLSRESSLQLVSPTALPKARASVSGGFFGGRVSTAAENRHARCRAASNDGSSWMGADMVVGGIAITAQPSQLRLPVIELSTSSINSQASSSVMPRRISFAGPV